MSYERIIAIIILCGHINKLNNISAYHFTDQVIIYVLNIVKDRILSQETSRLVINEHTSGLRVWRPKSVSSWRVHTISCIAMKQEIYSASMDETATIVWSLEYQLTGPPYILSTSSIISVKCCPSHWTYTESKDASEEFCSGPKQSKLTWNTGFKLFALHTNPSSFCAFRSDLRYEDVSQRNGSCALHLVP